MSETSSHAIAIFAFYRRGQLHHLHTDKRVFEKWMKDSPWLYPPSVCEIVRYVPDKVSDVTDLPPFPFTKAGDLP